MISIEKWISSTILSSSSNFKLMFPRYFCHVTIQFDHESDFFFFLRNQIFIQVKTIQILQFQPHWASNQPHSHTEWPHLKETQFQEATFEKHPNRFALSSKPQKPEPEISKRLQILSDFPRFSEKPAFLILKTQQQHLASIQHHYYEFNN